MQNALAKQSGDLGPSLNCEIFRCMTLNKACYIAVHQFPCAYVHTQDISSKSICMKEIGRAA